MPVISMDYMDMNERGDVDNCPIIVEHDSETEGVWALAYKHKGDDDYVVRKVDSIIARLGYIRMVINTDQEYAINEVDARIRERLNGMKKSIAHDVN